MGKRERLAQQIKDAEARWQRVGVLLGKLQLARELETRVEERLRLDALLAEVTTQRAGVEAELSALELQLDALVPTAPAPAAAPQLQVFWSYAPADAPLRDELARHLEVQLGRSAGQACRDLLLAPGGSREAAVAQRLAAAHVIIILLSADYLADDRLDCQELRPALARHDAGDALVVPIVLRACELADTPLAGRVLLPKDGLPVVAWPDRDVVLQAVAQQLQTLLGRLRASLARQPGERAAADAR